MMTRKTAARLGWGLAAAAAGLFAATVALGLTREPVRAVGETTRAAQDLVYLGGFVVFAVAGAIIVSRQPGSRVGWLLVGLGVTSGVNGFTFEYAVRALFVDPGSLPLGREAAWFGGWFWISTVIFLNLLLLLFPDGRPRWLLSRLAVWATVLAGTLLLAGVTLFWPHRGPDLPRSEELPGGVAGALVEGAIVALFGLVLLSIGLAIARFVRSRGEERLQMKWFTYSALLVGADFFVSELDLVGPSVLPFLDLVAILSIPVAIAIAVLRYRLYDIDLVINKTLVYGALAAFITAVYVGMVVGIGTFVGTRGEPNLGLQIGATALVAVAFQPVRSRVQRVANRLVYGERASPYEVLAGFAGRLGGSYAIDDVLPRLARVVAEGTRAASASVWIRVEDHLRAAARWPSGDGGNPVPVSPDEAIAIPEAERTLPVRHRGDLLGALSVEKSAGDPIRPEEDRLLEDLAAQAGLVLRNVGLTEELRLRLEDLTRLARELRESRRRIVAVGDAERRRLERDIHDGAQQHLVALAVQLKLARTVAAKGPEKARPLLEGLVRSTDETLRALRDLARGIYPPLLEAEGLAAALEAETERAPAHTEVVAGDLPRFPPDVEAAAYFSILEALQNAAKYAEASRVEVRLVEEEGELVFAVADDGKGFDPAGTPTGSGLQNMADRLATVGGTVDVDSAPGRGTTIRGAIPIREREPVA